MPTRCAWVEPGNVRYEHYHDTEWGIPVYDDRVLFEFLVLESAQAGLSWLTILRKRSGYRAAFAEFDPVAVAAYTEADIARLLQDSAIVRNRQKIRATVTNARQFLAVQHEFGSFSTYQWQFVGGAPVRNTWSRGVDVPATSAQAQEFSKDLKRRGFGFLGPTICYAHMQACGMVNDHTVYCFRHAEVAQL
ncbi:MAG: DNA-3-methyladenine glycosylase I [Mycobacteriales bacterium]